MLILKKISGQQLLLLSLLVLLSWPLHATAATPFADWLADFRRQAQAEGISRPVIEQALGGLAAPLERVIELDRRQPELTQTLSEYLGKRITPALIAEGREKLQRYPTWLSRIEQQYQVDRAFIVALWGIETRYGTYTGGFPAIHALATLAYDGRRGDYFSRELLNALRIIEQGHMTAAQMSGSWAGAMGQCQFMPSSFLRYAVDADGGGRIDLWGTIPDIFASIANYLQQNGWQPAQGWGQQVRIPSDFNPENSGLKKPLPVHHWQALGVRGMDNRALADKEQQASLLLPEGSSGPAYLIYDNFRVLLRWNRSNLFAIAVGKLADELGRNSDK
jgi:membrane-bound lytic murein transglycosylase B